MRLKDADEIKETIRRTKLVKWQKAIIWAIVDMHKTVDAVPVIRCRDCKWYYKGGATCMYLDGDNAMCENDYCSMAERRKDDRRQNNTV